MQSTRFLALLALLPAVALYIAATALWPHVNSWNGDLDIYARYADQLVQGLVPYRDFAPEYPPLALLSFVIPRWLVGGVALEQDQYRQVFLVEQVVFLGLMTLAMLLIGRRLRIPSQRAIWPLTLLSIILAPFMPWRFDLFPALLTAFAMLAIMQRQAYVGGVWAGLGVAAKLYPVVLGPIFIVWYAIERRWRALAWLIIGGALALIITVLPFFLLDREGLLGFLRYHELRGIQIESVAGGIVCLGQVFGWTQATPEFNYGALHLASPWASAMLPWLTPLFVGLYLLLLVVMVRQLRAAAVEPSDRATQTLHRMFVFCCAALLVFILTNKVFSPQYLVWLLPFVPLFKLPQIALFVALSIATVIIFPFGYGALLEFQAWAVVLLNLRNAATIGLLVWLVVDRRA